MADPKRPHHRPAPLALLAAAALAAGCGRPPAPAPPSLTALLDDAALTPTGSDGSPTELPTLEVLELDAGRTWIAVELDGATARRETRGGATVERLPLPFPARPSARIDAAPALIELPDGRRLTVGAAGLGPDVPGTASWLEDDALARRVEGPGEELPALRLRYPTDAAHLATAGRLLQESPGELLLSREYDAARSRRVLTLPEGLELRLPAAPGAVLSAELAAAPGVDLTLDGRPAAPDELAAGALPDGTRPLRLALDRERRLAARGGDLRLVAPRVAAADGRRPGPSVLLLILDTLRADRVGPWRAAESLTPELDRLLAESVLWERAWSTTSWTLPAIAGLLTGRQAADHGAYHAGAPLRRGVPSLAEAFGGSGYRTAAFTDGGYFQPSFGLDRGFDRFDGSFAGLRGSVPGLLDWLDREPDAAFFAVLHTYAVHEPYEPRDPRAAELLAGLSPEEAAVAVRPSLAVDPASAARPTQLPEHLIETMAALYDLEVRELDRELGRLFDALAERGLDDELLIAVVADHGEEFGERGLAGHGDTLFPEQLHVPLALRLPAERVGRRIAEPVSTVDLAATLLDAAGLDPVPLDVPGRSLLAPAPHSTTFAWRQPHGERGPLRAVRADGWLLTEGEFRFERPAEPDGLFALGPDPDATRDGRALDPTGAAAAEARLRALLEGFPEPPPIEAGALPAALEAQLEALGYR